MSDESKFYGDAKKYWDGIQPTVDGMLGGFSSISNTDLDGSAQFIRQFVRGADAKVKTHRALDCGAGIGRITKRMLLTIFDTVDMVELNQQFLNEAKKFLGDKATRVERYICSGLQDFTPECGRYDVIWSQWVLGHLKDEHLVAFFKRCKLGLAPHGIIVVKENFTSSGKVEFDEDDSSYTRPLTLFIDLIKKAGLNIIKEEKQKGFPKDIYEVRMFALS